MRDRAGQRIGGRRPVAQHVARLIGLARADHPPAGERATIAAQRQQRDQIGARPDRHDAAWPGGNQVVQRDGEQAGLGRPVGARLQPFPGAGQRGRIQRVSKA